MSSTAKCHLLNHDIYHAHPIMLLVIITFKNWSFRSNQICWIHSNGQLSLTSNYVSNRIIVTTTKTSRYTFSHFSTSLIFDGWTGYHFFAAWSETLEINALLVRCTCLQSLYLLRLVTPLCCHYSQMCKRYGSSKKIVYSLEHTSLQESPSMRYSD